MGLQKRTFDVGLALVLGLALLPVFGLIALAIKITSPGPVLFRQERLGRGGSTFLMNKFRKFPADWGSQGLGVTTQFDSRMTKIGRLLERTKLDELPQLWNILVGEMSFVGPRPESLKFRHLFFGQAREILEYKPGLFGPNQVLYRNESTMYPRDRDPEEYYEEVLFPAKIQNDIQYFRNATFFSDIAFVIKGTLVVFGSAIVWRKSMRVGALLLLWDIAAVLAAWSVAHWLKYSVVRQLVYSEKVLGIFKTGAFILPLVVTLVFLLTRVYRHPVRYFSETDVIRLAGAACGVWMVAAIVIRLAETSTSSLMIAVAYIISVAIMLLPRVAYRQLHYKLPGMRKKHGNRSTVLVCGVSQKSLGLCNLLATGFSNGVGYVGLLTDDSEQLAREIYGFKVLGMVSDLDNMHARYNFDQVWMTSNFDIAQRNKVQSWCLSRGVQSLNLEDLAGFRQLEIASSALNDKTKEVGSPPRHKNSAIEETKRADEVTA